MPGLQFSRRLAIVAGVVLPLVAAWGFACGMGYTSFFGQLAALSQSDPSGIQSSIVVAIKGIMLVAALAALIVTLRKPVS